MRTRGIVKNYIGSQRTKPYDVTIYNNKTRSFTDLHYLFVRVSQKEIWFPLWIFSFATYNSTRCIKIMYFLDHRHCLFLDLLASYHFLLVGCHHLNIHLVQSLDIFKLKLKISTIHDPWFFNPRKYSMKSYTKRGGSSPRLNPLTLYIPFLTKKEPLSTGKWYW